MHQPMAIPQGVKIGSGCIIGPHVAILAGVTLGERSFVAANAVLTQSVPPNSVVVGNPARVIRRYDRERGEWVDPEGNPSPIPGSDRRRPCYARAGSFNPVPRGQEGARI